MKSSSPEASTRAHSGGVRVIWEAHYLGVAAVGRRPERERGAEGVGTGKSAKC